MSDHETDIAEKPSVSIWKRLLLVSAGFVLLLVALGAGQHFFQGSRDQGRMTRMMSDLDESDPKWRLEEIEQARVAPPDTENSALVVRRARASMPKDAFDSKRMEPLDRLPPMPELLDTTRAALLDKEMTYVAAARTEARTLADLPNGRYTLVHAHNPIMTLLPHAQEAREIANLLRFDALDLAQKNRAGESLRSCRAALNTGRSFDDEPTLISQLVRIACVAVALSATERTLALGEPPAEELVRMQALLELEEVHPTLLAGLRGERGMLHTLLSRLADGSISTVEFGLLDHGGEARDWREWLALGDLKGLARREHPLVLELMGKAIDITRLPAHEQIDAEAKLNDEIKKAASRSIIVRLVLPAASKVSEACRRKVAQLRCMQALMAVERYRLEKGAWPKTLAELTPKLLKAVPIDPYDGKALRFKPVADGVIVYSVGPDRTDNGGNIDRTKPTTAGTDMGFQLWDVKHRRQAGAKAKNHP